MSPVFDLYGRWAVSSGVLDRIQEQVGMRSRRGIYSLVVVLWLMIWQRLQPHGSMSLAVRQLVQGGGGCLLQSCKRVREGRISCYCRTRENSRGRIPPEAISTGRAIGRSCGWWSCTMSAMG